MKCSAKIVLFSLVTLLLVGCAKPVQKAYWGANTSVALEEEKKGNFEQAEREFRLALQRAKNHLDKKVISDSLYNLGSFYRTQDHISSAIEYLKESLLLEESLSGPSSQRTGRRMAELAAAYFMEGNFVDGLPLAERLGGMASVFEGKERLFVDILLEEYRGDPVEYAAELSRLTPMAEKGDPEAQYQLANMYMDGRGVEQDFVKAIQLYESSSEQGFVDAQHYLGVIYDKGRGASQDDTKARMWYGRAAEGGSPISQYNYALFLMQGRGGEEDRTSAIEWLERSARQGYEGAERVLLGIAR